MYAFLSGTSALEALRYLAGDAPAATRWPQTPRRLPRWGDCVSKQREFKAFCEKVDLLSFGVTGDPVHLLVPDAASRSHGKRARFHVWQHAVPAHALVRLSDNLFASTPEFVLLQMAGYNRKNDPLIRQFVSDLHAAQEVQAQVGSPQNTSYDDPFVWARNEQLIRMALVASEFSGSYRLAAGERGCTYRLAPLVSFDGIRAFADGVPHLYGKSRLTFALGLAFERSASPMETALALMLSLPVEMGGYGLPRPSLNEQLPTDGFAALWDGGDHITPDLLWRDARLVIEYESDEFHSSLGAFKATSDATRANVLSAMGYGVLRATTGSVTSQVELDRLAHQVAIQLQVRLDEPDDVTRIRRHKLHALLMRQ